MSVPVGLPARKSFQPDQFLVPSSFGSVPVNTLVVPAQIAFVVIVEFVPIPGSFLVPIPSIVPTAGSVPRSDAGSFLRSDHRTPSDHSLIISIGDRSSFQPHLFRVQFVPCPFQFIVPSCERSFIGSLFLVPKSFVPLTILFVHRSCTHRSFFRITSLLVPVLFPRSTRIYKPFRCGS